MAGHARPNIGIEGTTTMNNMRSVFAMAAACAVTVCMVRSANASSYPPAVASLPNCSAANGCLPGVPSDFVLTPAGWFHPSCIVPVQSDEQYDMSSGIITRRNGSTRLAPPCGYLPRDRQGNTFTPANMASRPPSSSGWRATIWNKANIGAVSYLEASWKVPPTPAAAPTGPVYLFPAVTNATILQPVLGYNGNNGNGGTVAGWTITSWDCCDANAHNIMSDSPVPVNAGDMMYGKIAGSNCDAVTGVCSTWQVVTQDTTTNQQVVGTTTSNTQVYGTRADQVVGGALEAFVDACSQLPASTGTSFLSVLAHDINGANIAPANMMWTDMEWTLTPACSPTASETNGASNSTIDVGWSTSLAVPAMPPPTAGLIGLLLAGVGLTTMTSRLGSRKS